MGDMAVYAPNVKMALMLRERDVPVYMYLFDHRSDFNTQPAYMGNYNSLDLNYIFGTPYSKVQITTQTWQNYTYTDRVRSMNVMTMLSNYIREG